MFYEYCTVFENCYHTVIDKEKYFDIFLDGVLWETVLLHCMIKSHQMKTHM